MPKIFGRTCTWHAFAYRWQAEVQRRHALQSLASQLQPVARRLHLHAAWDVWAAKYVCSVEHQGANLRKVS